MHSGRSSSVSRCGQNAWEFLIGEENSYLLGTLIVTKIHQAAQARQKIHAAARHPFYFYIDEFQHFITPSMAAILSGARKYGLGLILAHQDLDQLAQKDQELMNSTLSNPAIRMCFRCGDRDAHKLEDAYAHFDATDLQSLGIGQSIVRIGRKDHDFNMSFDLIEVPDAESAEKSKATILQLTRDLYCSSAEIVEQQLAAIYGIDHQRHVKAPENVTDVTPSKAPREEQTSLQVEPLKTSPVEEIENHEGDIQSRASEFIKREQTRNEITLHRRIQEEILSIGHRLGCKSTLEFKVLDGAGSIDVVLEKDDLRIALEVATKNSVDYEVQNILKCAQAGFQEIVVVGVEKKHLKAIHNNLQARWAGQADKPNLKFLLRDTIESYLKTLIPPNTTTSRIKGYRVNVTQSSHNNMYKDILGDILSDTPQ